MTSSYSRPRQQAEIAFAKAQSQFLARERPADEIEAAAQARAEKTQRLKAAREERDLSERSSASPARTPRRTEEP